MRALRAALFGLLLLAATQAAAQSRFAVESGTQADGMATAQWLALVEKKNPDRLDAARERNAATPQESAWLALIQRRAKDWEAMVPAIAADYAPATPPAQVHIIVGNRGAEDAFTHDPATIGFDASALQANYGDATTDDNRARIDRFFRHEFVHLVQKAWLVDHPAETGSPMQRAALDMWTEGLGNRESLSPKWIDDEGRLTAHARKTLDALVPVMIQRLDALRTATPVEGKRLMEDLSSGPFDRKWGALPIALWLAEDAAKDRNAVRAFIERGPEGALDYAYRRSERWRSDKR